MKTYIFLPPVSKPTGGVTVLRQIADILHLAGREAFLVARESGGWRPEGLKDAAPVIEWDAMNLASGDRWLVPEGWVNALAPGLEAEAECISYVQNWAYLFSSLPPGVGWGRLPVSFLSVSDPVRYYIEQTVNRPAPVLRPGINQKIFHPGGDKPGNAIRIAYMPRKNKSLAAQIRAAFEARLGTQNIRWTPIEGMDAYGVANTLRKSHIFLMTGFPEGCPLPPLEAMACGCLCVGYSGFGGWDYMRQAEDSPRFTPWWPLRDVPWGGNGLWCADGDVLDAALSLETAVHWWQEQPVILKATLANAKATAEAYSPEAQKEAVLRILG